MKPREFWLHIPTSTMDSEVIWKTQPDPNRTAFPGEIHVVEKSAYDKAIAALKKYAAEFEFPDDAPGAWLAMKVLKELGEQE